MPAFAGKMLGQLNAVPFGGELSLLLIWLAAAIHLAEPKMVDDFPGPQCA